MISFRDRYNAYLAAQKIANRTATVLSLIITAGILVMLVLWFDLGADFLRYIYLTRSNGTIFSRSYIIFSFFSSLA